MLKKTDIPPLSKERRQYLKKQKQRKRHILYWQIGILVVFIAAWEIAARVGLIDSFILSQPTRILRTYFNMAQNDLLMHMGVTIYETLVGFLLGAALGTLLAIVLWWSAFVSKVSEPYLVVLNSLPKIALGPVIIILVGAGTKAIIFMAMATDKELIKMAATFGASKRQIFTKVVFPSNIVTLFNSLKINIGLSLVGVIAGEFLVSKAGLGYLIVYGGQVFQLDLVMASVIILSVVAALMYEGVVLLEKLVMRWYGH